MQTNTQPLLHMEITSERDSFFLYTLQVSEDEFHDLKNDQSLLVDFASFPAKFVDLLRLCCEGTENSENTNSNSKPLRFFAVLRVNDGVPQFRVVESNQFKQLTHLSLRFQLGTDETIKQYLSGRLKQTLLESENQKGNLEKTTKDLAETRRDFNCLSINFEELKKVSNKSQQEMVRNYTLTWGFNGFRCRSLHIKKS